MKCLRLILLCILFGAGFRWMGAAPLFYFSSLKPENGLSQLSVLKMYQDRNGFMWFGTRNGLNRYDGNSFVVYKHINGDSLSLSSNHITAITGDKNGYLWIGTVNGLNRLDLTTNQIYSFNDRMVYAASPIAQAWILCLYVDRKEQLWIGTNNGLFLYHRENGTFEKCDFGGKLPDNPIRVIGEDQKGNLLLGISGNGLYVCDREGHICAHYCKREGAMSLTDNDISAIFEGADGVLWVGTRLKGLNRIDINANRVKHYTVENGGLGNNSVRTIDVYNGQVIVGTYNGLSLLDPAGETCATYTNFDESKGGLSHFSVYSTYVDKTNTLWVGTYAGGVSYSNLVHGRFSFYSLDKRADKWFGILSTMAYQPERTLWIASEGRGLFEWDLETDTFERYLLDSRSDALNDRNIIKSVYVEGEIVWCGTAKGTLYQFDTRTKRFTLYYSFPTEVSIYTIARCSDGALWLGTTANTGITRILPNGMPAPEDSIFHHLPSVRSFMELRRGVYLIGMHTEGMAKYDTNTHTLTFYNTHQTGVRKLLNDQVSTIVKDGKGHVWVGTIGGGFSSFDEEKGIMECLTTADGLSDDNVNSIVPAPDGKLWISTGNGISAYDPDTHSFVNYTGENEIPVNEFSMKGGIWLSDGRIFFSGSNGLISFYPERLRENRFIPPVVLTSFTVNNKRVVPGDASDVLDKVLDYTQKIELEYDQNNFSIGYAALNYLYPNQNQYAYKLEGYDTDWKEVGHRKEAFYTNLKPGDYLFRVKASNNDGIWNDEGRSLKIHIRTPIWRTWYAYLVYVLFIGAIGCVIGYYLHMKRKLERDLEEKQKEQQQQEAFHQSKIRMFTNFSHELRTPLMLILSPLEEVLQRVDMYAGLKETLRLVYANAQRLLLLVNQLLDIRKNESGKFQLHVSYNDLYLFTQEMYVAFNQIAERKQVSFRLESDEPQLKAWFDQRLLEKVLFNLLSNAFKHTTSGDMVTIRLQSLSFSQAQEVYPQQVGGIAGISTQLVCLSVEDTGVGISEDDKQHIFVPFYQGTDENDRNMIGTGIGLSLVFSIVRLHHGVVWVDDNQPKGAVFRVLIPIDCDAYSVDEQETEKAFSVVDSVTVTESTEQRYTLLLVEDNEDVRQYVKKHLLSYYHVLEATDGVEAWDKVVEALPDLVISDLMMPKKDGLQLCREIKQDLRTGHIPVIIITAKSMVMHIKEGFRCGADDYIVKPFNIDILLYRVRNILASRERLKELYGKKFSLQSLGIETTSADERFMQKLFEVIEQRLADTELNVDVLCKGVGMGRANFYRKLKAVTNLSPVELIRNKRLEIAAKMLLETEMNVSEVSVRVGFNTHAYFATCFKNMYGLSPTEYVQQHKQ